MMKFYEVKGLEGVSDFSELRADAIMYADENGIPKVVIRLGALEALEMRVKMFFENIRKHTNFKLVETA